jgi:putative transcriptional regulator
MPRVLQSSGADARPARLESLLDIAAVTSYLDIRQANLTSMRNEIRSLRTAHGLSQQQLAEAMDVSRQTINSIEKERYTPSLPLAIALARYFGTTVEDAFHVDNSS